MDFRTEDFNALNRSEIAKHNMVFSSYNIFSRNLELFQISLPCTCLYNEKVR